MWLLKTVFIFLTVTAISFNVKGGESLNLICTSQSFDKNNVKFGKGATVSFTIDASRKSGEFVWGSSIKAVKLVERETTYEIWPWNESSPIISGHIDRYTLEYILWEKFVFWGEVKSVGKCKLDSEPKI